MAAGRRYWLMKSEPDVYSIDDLERDGKTHWDGVRNYKARNFMRDDMKVGDLVLFYHSNAKPPGVAGVARVCREGYPDFTAFDTSSKYYDAKSKEDAPTWIMVDVEYVETFPEIVGLDQLKEEDALEEMMVIRRGMRLSVQPVEKPHFDHVLKMAKRAARR